MPYADYNEGLAHRRAYKKTVEGRARQAEANKAWRARNKIKRAAHNIVARAVSTGKLVPLSCWVCDKPAQAHHPDYSSPLDVVWLCDTHHKEAHKIAKTF